MDRAVLVRRVGEDGGAGLRRERGHGGAAEGALGARLSGGRGVTALGARLRAGLVVLRSTFFFFFFSSFLGEGRKEGSKKVIWGLIDKVVFLFGVAPNLCVRPALKH